MFTLKELYQLVYDTSATPHTKRPCNIFYDQFVDAIDEKVKKSLEWKIQDELNNGASKGNLNKALLCFVVPATNTVSYEVVKSMNYREANPRYDVTINIPQSVMADYMEANPKDPNPRSSIANKFPKVVESLGITVEGLGRFTKSMIGNVVVE